MDRGFGRVSVFTIDKPNEDDREQDVKKVIPVVAHYGERGNELRHLSRYEYEALVQVKEKPPHEENAHSKTFDFQTGHPLAARYT